MPSSPTTPSTPPASCAASDSATGRPRLPRPPHTALPYACCCISVILPGYNRTLPAPCGRINRQTPEDMMRDPDNEPELAQDTIQSTPAEAGRNENDAPASPVEPVLSLDSRNSTSTGSCPSCS